jgi:hypothetical protein
MKHLKYFENYDFGRFDDEEEKDNLDEIDFTENDEDEFANEVEDEDDDFYSDEDEEEEQEEESRIRRWGDEEIVEKKKINPGFQAYLDKQKGKKDTKDSKDDKKDDKKDAKGAKGKKDDDKKEEPKKGLTAGQKKLPKAMQDAILKKQKK